MDSILTAAQTAKDVKIRLGSDGVHYFNRRTGINILLDEIPIANESCSKAPRQVSIALTNTCDLSCSHCYAPKHRAVLNLDLLKSWLLDLDAHGCLSVGFGGGEPTLYPKFADLCEFVSNNTRLALTMTTHGHRLSPKILQIISQNMNFVRVSMDGINSTYESIRGRPFQKFIDNVKLLSKVVPFGINIVVNQHTVGDLTEAAELAENLGASEFLLLPEVAVGKGANIESDTKMLMQHWINKYNGKTRLAISQSHTDGIPMCEPFRKEVGLNAYAHIDAGGILKASSFDQVGIQIKGVDLVGTIKTLKEISQEINI